MPVVQFQTAAFATLAENSIELSGQDRDDSSFYDDSNLLMFTLFLGIYVYILTKPNSFLQQVAIDIVVVTR